jgi:hypothetical protein
MIDRKIICSAMRLRLEALVIHGCSKDSASINMTNRDTCSYALKVIDTIFDNWYDICQPHTVASTESTQHTPSEVLQQSGADTSRSEDSTRYPASTSGHHLADSSRYSVPTCGNSAASSRVGQSSAMSRTTLVPETSLSLRVATKISACWIIHRFYKQKIFQRKYDKHLIGLASILIAGKVLLYSFLLLCNLKSVSSRKVV